MPESSSILDSILSRIKHPFIGTFALSLLLHNWQLFIISFTGTLQPEARIQLFKNYLGEQGLFLWMLWLDPLLFATAFILILPWISTISRIYFEYVEYERGRMSEKAAIKYEYNHKINAPRVLIISKETIRLTQSISQMVQSTLVSLPNHPFHDGSRIELGRALELTKATTQNLQIIQRNKHLELISKAEKVQSEVTSLLDGPTKL